MTVKTRLTGDLSPIDTIAGILKNRIVDIAKWTRFTKVNVVFESSDRADRHIERAFADFRLEENGAPSPVECYFMSKAAHDAPRRGERTSTMRTIGRGLCAVCRMIFSRPILK